MATSHGVPSASLSTSPYLPVPASTSPHQPSRVTRSSARRAADSPSESPPQPTRPPTRSQASRKRKAASQPDSSPLADPSEQSPPTPRRSKRQKINASAENSPPEPKQKRATRRSGGDTAMSNTGYGATAPAEDAELTTTRSSSKYTDDPSKPPSKRPASRSNKKATQDVSPSTQTPPARRQKKRSHKKDLDLSMRSDDDPETKAKHDENTTPPPPPDNEDSGEGASPDGGGDMGTDPFSAALFGTGRGPPSGLSSTLRALSGMMSGMSSRLRDILNNLRQNDNPTMQMVALEELSNLLLVSNEDNLSGQFSPDPYIKELVALMQPNPLTGEENPEMMLLACRSIANLMEALRGSVANVVYGGAVPVLCQKLLDIQYIDVAEQALSTLSKVSVDFPASIVREGGLTACLQFLDFFATGTQRTAVTTAANCCRNIPHDSFPVIKDVMPILQNVLSSHDQKVVEQGCLCVTRVIDSFKYSPEKLEELVEPALLRAVLGLLLPGSTNLIGSNIHTEFLRVLAIIARASPSLSAELLKMNVVDTLYQILTGVSPPDETANAASKIDSVVIMQALIHRPREQVYETLNVICELLPRPKPSATNDFDAFDGYDNSMSGDSGPPSKVNSRTTKRLELLKGCTQETRRFAVILLPTLTDAYSSTVNLSVRQKVLTAQLKILSNLETSVIEEALRPVPYASFLASILSQEDHPSLVMFALQASELLFNRLEDIYQYQFHREGVIGEIQKLADRTLELDGKVLSSKDLAQADSSIHQTGDVVIGDDASINEKLNEPHEDDDDDDGEDDIEVDAEDQENEDAGDDGDDGDDDGDDPEEQELVIRDHGIEADSDSSDEEVPSPIAISGINDLVVMRAQKFLEKYDTDRGRQLKSKAAKIRDDLQMIAGKIESSYAVGKASTDARLFERLAKYFQGDALESITSSELLDSGIIRVLGTVLASDAAETIKPNPRGDFLSAFVGTYNMAKIKTTTASSASTALSVLIHKLQDLLSRAEHFEVLTVNNNAAESSRSSSTSMLSRQIRLRLTAEPDSDIPQSYRDMVVSIHAIAPFKALDDYLRPRFSMSDRPVAMSRRREMLQQLANARMAQLSGAAESGLFSPFGQELGSPVPASGLGEGLPLPRPSSRAKPASQAKPRADTKPPSRTEKRRSSRRTMASSSAADIPPPDPNSESNEPKLEVADEKALRDETGTPMSGEETLETFVEGLDEDMSDEDLPEPAAVNMEIASTGKVTARQEDGTRIVTPQPGTPVPGSQRTASSSDSPSLPPFTKGLAVAGRPSYAAALASTPQDWHLEFSIDGKTIPSETTIYRAVHHNREQPIDSSRGVWSGVHTITFKKVKGPPPSQSSLTTHTESDQYDLSRLPASLDGHPITSTILSLMRILHDLNGSIDDVRETLGRAGVKLYAEPLASFINTKLTAKMNRQLEEPLIVASNCLPDWATDLARTFPFLFPFETRHLFLQSTSFGYARSMVRWQNNQAENDDRRDRRRDDRPPMGRPQRQKVRISRSRILESALKVMEMYGPGPSVLEVEYFEEVGTGLGPTLEFYSTVSKEFSKKRVKMWRENDSITGDEYAFGKNGLFPTPMSDVEAKAESGKKLLHFFKNLGKFVARSMMDSRIIDISFNPTFFKLATNNSLPLSIGLLRTIDQDLANSVATLQHFANAKAKIEEKKSLTAVQKEDALNKVTIKGARIEDMMLDFTLPGYPAIELVPGGSDVPVTIDNVASYIDRVLNLSLGNGVRRQIEAFKTGFTEVFPVSSLRAFTPNELVMLFGRVEEDWSIETLMDSVKADHGFNMDSKSVKNLLQTMSELTKEQRRDFLQFVTGSPKLPIGGFKSLTPMFTVVCKPSDPPFGSDDYLPSVMTCVNYLKLPDYSTQEVLKQKLGVAMREGQGAFHLS